MADATVPIVYTVCVCAYPVMVVPQAILRCEITLGSFVLYRIVDRSLSSA